QHRHREQPGADYTRGKQRESELARDRAQGFGGMRGRVDLGDARRAERRRRGDNDEEGDEVRGEHAYPGIERNLPEGLLPRIGAQAISGAVTEPGLLGLLRSLPEEQI